MKKTILMSVSVLAMLSALPALAVETTVKTEPSTGAKVEAQMDKAGNAIERAADKTGAVINKAADKTENAAKNAYNDVKTYFTDDKNVSATSSVNISEGHTAKVLLGTNVQDAAGKQIGKIHDIIVGSDGDAKLVIIEDGGVLGLGSKMAAFDYDVIKGFNHDKDVSVKLTESSIKSAKAFEYEANADTKAGMKTTIPAGEFSVKKIIGSDVVGPDGKKIATVDTVAFDGDEAEYLIVSFDKILGMGGEKAALDFDALDMVNTNGKYSVKLNSQQTAQFENYKSKTKAN